MENAIDFYVCDGTTLNDINNGSTRVMTLDGSGNVGIGTTNPTKKLEVSGDISCNALTLEELMCLIKKLMILIVLHIVK